MAPWQAGLTYQKIVLSLVRGNDFLGHLVATTYSPPPNFTSYICDYTMSFGFSVGDFIALLNLANTVRRQFVDAPAQFKAISDE